MGATLGSHAHREDGHGTGAEPVEGSCGADAYWPIEANDCAPVGARTTRSSNREQTPDRQRSCPDPATSARRPLVTAHAVRPQGCSKFLYWIKAARYRGPRALAAGGRRRSCLRPASADPLPLSAQGQQQRTAQTRKEPRPAPGQRQGGAHGVQAAQRGRTRSQLDSAPWKRL